MIVLSTTRVHTDDACDMLHPSLLRVVRKICDNDTITILYCTQSLSDAYINVITFLRILPTTVLISKVRLLLCMCASVPCSSPPLNSAFASIQTHPHYDTKILSRSLIAMWNKRKKQSGKSENGTRQVHFPHGIFFLLFLRFVNF